MKKVQNYKITMHLNTQSVLNENAFTLEKITTYQAQKTKIDNSISKEQELASNQMVLKKYTAAAKNSVRNAAGEYTLDLSSKLKAIAIGRGDYALLDRVKLTATWMKRSPDYSIVTRMHTLLTCAGENLEALACYGVTPQTLADGKALYDKYDASILELRCSKNKLTTITEQLGIQIKKTLSEIHKVDAILDSLRISDPKLYSKYWNARAKRNAACTKVSVKGKAFDSDTEKPLRGAILTVVRSEATGAQSPASKPVRKIRIRSYNGRFQFKLLSTGAYLFKVTYAGYNDQETIVYINEGVLTKVKIPLNKIA